MPYYNEGNQSGLYLSVIPLPFNVELFLRGKQKEAVS